MKDLPQPVTSFSDYLDEEGWMCDVRDIDRNALDWNVFPAHRGNPGNPFVNTAHLAVVLSTGLFLQINDNRVRMG